MGARQRFDGGEGVITGLLGGEQRLAQPKTAGSGGAWIKQAAVDGGGQLQSAHHVIDDVGVAQGGGQGRVSTRRGRQQCQGRTVQAGEQNLIPRRRTHQQIRNPHRRRQSVWASRQPGINEVAFAQLAQSTLHAFVGRSSQHHRSIVGAQGKLHHAALEVSTRRRTRTHVDDDDALAGEATLDPLGIGRRRLATQTRREQGWCARGLVHGVAHSAQQSFTGNEESVESREVARRRRGVDDEGDVHAGGCGLEVRGLGLSVQIGQPEGDIGAGRAIGGSTLQLQTRLHTQTREGIGKGLGDDVDRVGNAAMTLLQRRPRRSIGEQQAQAGERTGHGSGCSRVHRLRREAIVKGASKLVHSHPRRHIVSMKPVTIYTTTTCPFCVRAKQVLKSNDVPFEEIDVSNDDARRKWLLENTGQRTVPQIFIGTLSIGGCVDLEAVVKKGELKALLA